MSLTDYRDVAGQFDAVASIEMVEAVGERWWPTYLDAIARNLKPGGKAALQYISIDHRLFDAYSRSPDFIQAYIFPGGMLIDEPRFEALAKERGLGWQDRDGFGLDYGETLKIWRERYDAAVRDQQAALVHRLLPRVRDIRRFGSAALDLAWTAAGRYDAYFERGVKAWDVAAGRLMCARAGLEVLELPAAPPSDAGILVAPAAFAQELFDAVVDG